MSSIRSFVATLSGTVSYVDGSVGQFSANIDEQGNISSNGSDITQIYAIISNVTLLQRLNRLLFGTRAEFGIFVSPSPLSVDYVDINDYTIKIDGIISYVDGTSESFSLNKNGPLEILSDNLQSAVDKILLNSIIKQQYTFLLDRIFGSGYCIIDRDDSAPFTGSNTI